MMLLAATQHPLSNLSLTYRELSREGDIMKRLVVLLTLATVLVSGCVRVSTTPIESSAAATTAATTAPTTAPVTGTLPVSPPSTEPPPPQIQGVVLPDVSDLVQQVEGGVVTVTQKRLTIDLFLGRQLSETGTGTGIVIDDQGHILTNFHVVAGADQLTVVGRDAKARSATVIGAFPENDIAVLRVDDPSGLEPLPLGSAGAMLVGDPVVAIGNALGLDSSEPTVTTGILSAKNRTINTNTGATLTGLLQTDAAINPGNSGGPLLNEAGQVIGINTAIAGGAQNIGFAIPIDTVLPLVDQVLAGVGTPYIGISMVENSADYQQRFGLSTDKGVIVTDVLPAGPADQAGLRPGDIIIEVNGEDVTSADALADLVKSSAPGDTLTFTVVRGNQQGTVDVTVGER